MTEDQRKQARAMYVDGVALASIAVALGVPIDDVRAAVLGGANPAPGPIEPATAAPKRTAKTAERSDRATGTIIRGECASIPVSSGPPVGYGEGSAHWADDLARRIGARRTTT
jgi:hypothetical protein